MSYEKTVRYVYNMLLSQRAILASHAANNSLIVRFGSHSYIATNTEMVV